MDILTARKIGVSMQTDRIHIIPLSRKYKVLAVMFFVVAAFFAPGNLSAQEENLNVLERWTEWSDAKTMLMRHLNQQAFQYLDRRDEEISVLATEADWRARQQKVRETLNHTVGPFPDKTPLNAKITGTLKEEGFRIEKVIYESMPGFPVTGCLYIPEGRGKKPAVLFVSGHTNEGFRYPSYQVMILNLVKKGFIVFAIDPVSQGERIQIFDAAKNASAIGPTTREHNHLGRQTFLSGVSLARYFIWDGIRAVDYLLTRKEVDTDRIGITGQSGGGTQTAYIFAFDDRIKAAAVVNYITGFRRLLESIGPQDAEQNFNRGIINGLTHADLLEVRAPAPVLISAGTRDFFSIQGARETFAEVSKTYTAFGKAGNLRLEEDDFGHGYTQLLREGIYDFFRTSLEHECLTKDEEVRVLDEKDLWVTSSGQTASSLENTETVFSLNRKEAARQLEALNNSRKAGKAHAARALTTAKTLSGYQEPEPGEEPVFRGRYRRDGYSVEMYALKGEGRGVGPLLLFVPDGALKLPAMVWLHPQGKAVDARPGARVEQLVKKGYVVAAPDLSGTGEVENSSYGADYLSFMIGRSITGIQAGDVSRVIRFLEARNEVDNTRIEGVAFGEMGPVLLHAAAFTRKFSGVTLMGSLESYGSVAMERLYDARFVNQFVAGALMAYDLPDLAASLAPANLLIINPLAGNGDRKASAGADLDYIRSVYLAAGMPGRLNMVYRLPEDEAFSFFLDRQTHN